MRGDSGGAVGGGGDRDHGGHVVKAVELVDQLVDAGRIAGGDGHQQGTVGPGPEVLSDEVVAAAGGGADRLVAHVG